MFPSQYREIRQPDILDCIANLSNDEVFTSPALANKILDLLPKEVWTDEKLRFLDPCCKTGIFLREIAKRLMDGLKDKIQDEKKRREHIFKNQIYGIALTTLTSLMSRRSLYYSKDASGKNSATVVKFQNKEGNIFFKSINHSFKNDNCEFCGQSRHGEVGKREMDGSLETHAYNFIHLKMEEIFNMRFDVIVGNPPYQLKDGEGGNGTSATPIYQLFIETARKLNPRYMAFIIPSRWFVGGKGLNDFRSSMLNDKRLKELVDYPNSSDCFPTVEIKGGVCYFVWDNNYHGDCNIKVIRGDNIVSEMKRSLNQYDVFIRENEAISILEKIKQKNENAISAKVSESKPFGVRSDFFKGPFKYNLPNISDKPLKEGITIYGILDNKATTRFVKKDYPFPKKFALDKYKIFLSKAGSVNGQIPNKILGTLILGKPFDACTETYLAIECKTLYETQNLEKYIKTKFFRFLTSLRTPTQNIVKNCFEFVPDLPLNEEWTDEKLYKRYNLNEEEIKFIESMIREMN
jgi:site-specific DNA-methyltransferase (adenine-specific)